jgi:hypothetical protein
MRRVLPSLALAAFVFSQGAACGSGGGQPTDGGTDTSSGPDVLTCGSSTQTICNTACTDTSSDVYNCGQCNNACAGGEACCTGFCVKSSGCGFAVTGMTPQRGNQSGGDWIAVAGTGFTPDMSVYIGTGRAPTLVIDATHARIQTPPGLVGVDDVTLVETSGSSTTHKAFQYVAAGLSLPWQQNKMSAVRAEHPGVTVLQDGRVLVAGGTTVPDDPTMALSTGELFTRGAGTSPNSLAVAANNMVVPRWRDAAVTMLDGRALIAGGAVCSGTNCQTADLFDPKTNTFTATANLMTVARAFVWGVLMVDGRVMFTSGGSPTVDIYDPKSDSFSSLALPVVHQFGQRIVRLRDGRIMVMGGDGCNGTCGPAQTEADIYDPATGKFAPAAPMNQGRTQFTAHTLPDGRVMVFGGASSSAGGVANPMTSIEAYDPAANTWTVETYALTVGRTWHASALVRDGTVLVMGGYTQNGSCAPSASVDQVDPIAGTVVSFGTLPNPNTEWNAVTLLDGSVLGVGGGACGGVALPDLDFLPGAPGPT